MRKISAKAAGLVAGVLAGVWLGGACGHSTTAGSSTAGPAPPSGDGTTVAPPTTVAPGPVPTVGPAATAATEPVPPPATVASPGRCHVRGSGLLVLPDPACTPGADNPEVTQGDIGSTICRSGWTSTVRPPEAYTEELKVEGLAAYGESGPISRYEEDHLVPLELGGAPSDPANLWPEPGASPNPKDKVEDEARRRVCSGSMPLASARQAIAADWIAFGRQIGVIAGP